jgi:YjjG family noncanonical pyrimidine nucleotidase
MKSYEVIFLDADDTLFDFEAASAYALEKACTRRGLGFDQEVFELYTEINLAAWADYEKGQISRDALRLERFRIFFERLGLSAGAEYLEGFSRDYLSFMGEAVFPLPGAEELCAWLSERYTLGVITNGFADVQRSRFGASPLGKYISSITVSDEAGYNKPNPRIFEYAAERLGLTSKNGMLMVGDSLSSDIQGGINFGIDTCWLNRQGKENGSGLVPSFEIRELGELKTILQKGEP